MKKKILSTVLVFTMAFAMTACGSKGDAGNKVTVTVDEVQDKMVEAMADVKSVELGLEVVAGMDMEAEGQKMEMDLGFNAEAKATVDNPAGYVKYSGNMKMDADGDSMDEKIKGEAYVLTENEAVSLYYNTDDAGWYKGEATLEELTSALESALESSGMDMESILSFATVEGDATNSQKPELSSKTVEAEGKECYELVLKMNKEMMEKELESADDEMLAEVQTYVDMFDTLEGSMKLYVDVDTNLPVKVEYDMDMVMNIDMYGSTMKMNMDDFSIEMTADYNNVKAIEVPSDVKDNAINLAE